MNNLVQIIEEDNLEAFKKYFDISKWQESITKIENYAGVSQYNPIISYNDCDVLKYALHKNSDKIFNYLLPLLDTDKHGDNYGWPLLSMALNNGRYDYAHSIINHHSFNPYQMYHTNHFRFIDSNNNPEKHIDFLFNYLQKFISYDFKTSHLLHIFTHLICYNETTFQKFQSVYQEKLKDSNLSIFNIFKDNLKILGQEVFYNYFRPFILDKLQPEQFRNLFSSIMNENIIFARLFENEDNQAQTSLNYLIQYPDLLQEHVNKNPVIFSYLPLSCLIFLQDNNIDLFNDDIDKIAVVHFILDNDNLEDEKTLYFMENHTQEVYDMLQKSNKKNKILIYCDNLLLSNKLTEKHTQNKKRKI